MSALLPPPLATRVPGPELMDDVAGTGGAELAQTLRELRRINRLLGGHATSLRALDALLARAAPRTALEILDVGGGSGDFAPAALAWGRRRGIDVRVTVVDLHPETVAAARAACAGLPGVRVEQGDLFALEPRRADVVHAALFLHHFDGDAAARALAAMARAARVGIVVNDLHRHPVPWFLIRVLTLAFSRNRLIRADAPHSVARAFVADDWRRLATATRLDLRFRRAWAWRWAVHALLPEVGP